MTGPVTLSALTHPHTRSELIAYLSAAANPECWKDATEVSFLVHFIFDDHDFQPAEEQIGKTLLNKAEASALNDFVTCLETAIGPRSKPLSALKAADWAPVASAAAISGDALALTGERTP